MAVARRGGQRPMALLSAAPASPAPLRGRLRLAGLPGHLGRTRGRPGLAQASTTTSPGGQALQHFRRVQRAQAQLHVVRASPGRHAHHQHRGDSSRRRCAAPTAAAPARARGARFPPRPTASCLRAERQAPAPAAAQTSLPPRRAAGPPPARPTARALQSAGRQRHRPPRWRPAPPATGPENVRPPGLQLRGARQRQAQQGLAGLHDLPGLHRARQHPGIGRRQHHGLRQPRPGRLRGRLRQRQLRLAWPGRSRCRHWPGPGCARWPAVPRHVHARRASSSRDALTKPCATSCCTRASSACAARAAWHRPGPAPAGPLAAGAAQAGQPRLGLRSAAWAWASAAPVRPPPAAAAHRPARTWRLRPPAPGHPAGERAAHVHARQRGHAGRELQRAHQRRAHLDTTSTSMRARHPARPATRPAAPARHPQDQSQRRQG
jgi:hypothetical protein